MITWLVPTRSDISPLLRSRTWAMSGPARAAFGSPAVAGTDRLSTVARPGTRAIAPTAATPNELPRNLRRDRPFIFTPSYASCYLADKASLGASAPPADGPRGKHAAWAPAATSTDTCPDWI